MKLFWLLNFIFFSLPVFSQIIMGRYAPVEGFSPVKDKVEYELHLEKEKFGLIQKKYDAQGKVTVTLIQGDWKQENQQIALSAQTSGKYTDNKLVSKPFKKTWKCTFEDSPDKGLITFKEGKQFYKLFIYKEVPPLLLKYAGNYKQEPENMFNNSSLFLAGDENLGIYTYGEYFSLSSYQGGDCGGMSSTWEGTYEIKDNLLILHFFKYSSSNIDLSSNLFEEQEGLMQDTYSYIIEEKDNQIILKNAKGDQKTVFVKQK